MGRKRWVSIEGSEAVKLASELGKKYPDKEQFLSPNDIGELLGCTGEAVKQWIYNNRLSAIKQPNGYWKIKVKDLEAYLKSRSQVLPKVMVFGKEETGAVIQKLGNVVIVCSAYVDAVLKAAYEVPNLFVIDVSHPDAWKFLDNIRKSKKLKRSRIALFGKTLSDQQLEKALKLSARTMIDPDNIESDIRKAMG